MSSLDYFTVPSRTFLVCLVDLQSIMYINEVTNLLLIAGSAVAVAEQRQASVAEYMIVLLVIVRIINALHCIYKLNNLAFILVYIFF